jgi:hypothetical protein
VTSIASAASRDISTIGVGRTHHSYMERNTNIYTNASNNTNLCPKEDEHTPHISHDVPAHEPLWKGDTVVSSTNPLKPALHSHPTATWSPLEFAGQSTAAHVLLKNGETVTAMTSPRYPELQEHPATTSAPSERAGHATSTHVLSKNGEAVVAVTDPLKPALQAQPAGTSAPSESTGHTTATS